MFYLRSSLDLSGTDASELVQYCQIIDENTSIQKFNYTECNILHYLRVENEKMYFLSITPGEKKVRDDYDEVSPFFGRSVGTLSLKKMEKAGIIDILPDIRENKTAFIFSDRGKADIIFTSVAFRRTMAARLPVSETVPYTERDLLLARKIGEYELPLTFYTVMRDAGDYHLGIGMFARSPKRAAWSEVLNFALSSGTIRRLKWHIDQSKGLEITIQYKEETEAIKSSFPGCKYEPFHIFNTCDSGYISDAISDGWLDPENPEESAFISNENKVKDSWEEAFSKGLAHHVKEAEFLASDGGDIFPSEEEMIRCYIRAFHDSETDALIGSKGVKRFLRYAAEHFRPGFSRKDARELIVTAMMDRVFKDHTPYAGKIMPQKAAGMVIKAI